MVYVFLLFNLRIEPGAVNPQVFSLSKLANALGVSKQIDVRSLLKASNLDFESYFCTLNSYTGESNLEFSILK